MSKKATINSLHDMLGSKQIKKIKCDLEDSLTWVEKKICVELGLHQVCERSEPLDETQLNTNFFFNPS